jgi:hypothetical protein
MPAFGERLAQELQWSVAQVGAASYLELAAALDGHPRARDLLVEINTATVFEFGECELPYEWCTTIAQDPTPIFIEDQTTNTWGAMMYSIPMDFTTNTQWNTIAQDPIMDLTATDLMPWTPWSTNTQWSTIAQDPNTQLGTIVQHQFADIQWGTNTVTP